MALIDCAVHEDVTMKLLGEKAQSRYRDREVVPSLHFLTHAYMAHTLRPIVFVSPVPPCMFVCLNMNDAQGNSILHLACKDGNESKV